MLETPGSLPPLICTTALGPQRLDRKRFCARRESAVVRGGRCMGAGMASQTSRTKPGDRDQLRDQNRCSREWALELCRGLQYFIIKHHMWQERNARTFFFHSSGLPIRYTSQVKGLVTQSYPTLCNPMDCSLPGFSVHGILQARILERSLFPTPGDLPHPEIEPGFPALQADSLPSEPPGKP